MNAKIFSIAKRSWSWSDWEEEINKYKAIAGLIVIGGINRKQYGRYRCERNIFWDENSCVNVVNGKNAGNDLDSYFQLAI